MAKTEDPVKKVERVLEEYETHVVRHVNAEFRKHLKLGDRIADRVARFGGSWTFIIIFWVFIMLWMAWNATRGGKAPDPYPFILLNLVLSCLAAIQAPIIMMAQNRAEEREHIEADIDYAINYKAEEEIADMQSDLHLIHRELGRVREENRALKGLLEELLKRIPAEP